MKQRALTFGVLSNPYRTVEAGQEFDHQSQMKWAVPVEDIELEPEPELEAAPRRKKRAEPEPEPADPI